MRQPHLMHDALGSGVDFRLCVVDELGNQAIPYRTHAGRLGQLHRLRLSAISRVDLPPELEPDQAS